MLLILDKRVDSILFINNTCIDDYNFPLLWPFGYTSAAPRFIDQPKIMKSYSFSSNYYSNNQRSA